MEFVKEIRRLHEAVGGPESARTLREYLAGHDARCDGCGYNLRGLLAARCPECGLQISRSDFPGENPAESG